MAAKPSRKQSFLALFIILAVTLGWLFRSSALPDNTTFNNDTPLGVMHSDWLNGSGAMNGIWQDLNWLGAASVGAVPNVTYLFYKLLGPLGFSWLPAIHSLRSVSGKK